MFFVKYSWASVGNHSVVYTCLFWWYFHITLHFGTRFMWLTCTMKIHKNASSGDKFWIFFRNYNRRDTNTRTRLISRTEVFQKCLTISIGWEKNYSLYLENICFSWVFPAEWMHTHTLQSINTFLNYESIKSNLKVNPIGKQVDKSIFSNRFCSWQLT